jgi:hypothetical protein
MNTKRFTRAWAGFMLMLLMTSLTSFSAPARYSPVGTWQYSVPGVPEGYDRGLMVITEGEEGLQVSIGPTEEYLSPVQDVEYSKKTLRFKVVVEYEEVLVTGEFDQDEFTGTVSYVEGTFDMTATRILEDSSE